MTKNTLILLTLCLTLSQVWAQVSSPKSIALSEFRGHQITEVQLELFTNQLRTALVQQGHFSVVERDRVDLVLQEQGFSQSGSTQEAIELGTLLKVDYIPSLALSLTAQVDSMPQPISSTLRRVKLNTVPKFKANQAKKTSSITRLIYSLARLPTLILHSYSPPSRQPLG